MAGHAECEAAAAHEIARYVAMRTTLGPVCLHDRMRNATEVIMFLYMMSAADATTLHMCSCLLGTTPTPPRRPYQAALPCTTCLVRTAGHRNHPDRPCALTHRLQSSNDQLTTALKSAAQKADDNASALSDIFHHVAAKDKELAALKAEMQEIELRKADACEQHARQLLEAEARGATRAEVCPAVTLTPAVCSPS